MKRRARLAAAVALGWGAILIGGCQSQPLDHRPAASFYRPGYTQLQSYRNTMSSQPYRSTSLPGGAAVLPQGSMVPRQR